jgi:hypothetical protein
LECFLEDILINLTEFMSWYTTYFPMAIDWLSLHVLLKNSPKMWTANQASSLGEKSHPKNWPQLI